MTTIYTIDVRLSVDVEQGEHGLFYATSPLIRGLLTVGASADEALAKVPAAIYDLSAAARS